MYLLLPGEIWLIFGLILKNNYLVYIYKTFLQQNQQLVVSLRPSQIWAIKCSILQMFYWIHLFMLTVCGATMNGNIFSAFNFIVQMWNSPYTIFLWISIFFHFVCLLLFRFLSLLSHSYNFLFILNIGSLFDVFPEMHTTITSMHIFSSYMLQRVLTSYFLSSHLLVYLHNFRGTPLRCWFFSFPIFLFTDKIPAFRFFPKSNHTFMINLFLWVDLFLKPTKTISSVSFRMKFWSEFTNYIYWVCRTGSK